MKVFEGILITRLMLHTLELETQVEDRNLSLESSRR